jgi:lipase chaperone LimK
MNAFGARSDLVGAERAKHIARRKVIWKQKQADIAAAKAKESGKNLPL